MAEPSNDKYSIKNLLFTKAIPNYVIPVPTAGYKVYPCTDCGDKFLFQSSYDYHVNRKTVKITYNCKHCNQVKIFNNRCNMLSHIRSHAFKTATINVSDLKVEPLPMCYFAKIDDNNPVKVVAATQGQVSKKQKNGRSYCTECNKDITSTGTIYRDRKSHFMEYTNKVYSCPVCMFTLPTNCGLQAHLRLHQKEPPFYCPECGVHLSTKNVNYPYHHDCEGFNMMRATARSRCPAEGCQILHPNFVKQHMKSNHLKLVHKCPLCNVACFSQDTIERHLKSHSNTNVKAILFYQCEMCPGKLVSETQVDNHLKNHHNQYVYPCWTCGSIFASVKTLLTHSVNVHNSHKHFGKEMSFEAITTASNSISYRVVKRCDQCKRSFRYKCRYDQIHTLPAQCPYKCSTKSKNDNESTDVQDSVEISEPSIVCGMCQMKIPQKWEIIKEHMSIHHKMHKCLDLNVLMQKTDIIKKLYRKKRNIKIRIRPLKKINRKARRKSKNVIVKIPAATENPVLNIPNNFVCKCGKVCENKEMLEKHLLEHRDPCMAYQCMECGQCFVVKPSFSKHLLLEHKIEDVEHYISTKECYNESALEKTVSNECEAIEPVRENQCKVCRVQFETSLDLEKHFRIHGMAFLLQNASSKSSTPSP